MKKSVTRIAAAVLTAALSLNCLTGCSKITERIQNGGGNGGGSGKLEVSLDHSYSSEKIEFNEMANVYECYEFGGKMLLNGSDSQYNNCSYLYDPTDGSSKKVEYVYPTTLEEGSETLSKESLMNEAMRAQKFITGLQAALVRIQNKTYGICRETGKLIPKERLRAVPHATLSIEAKQARDKKH